MILQKNVSLKEFTSWRVGGAADFYVEPLSVDEVTEAIQWARTTQNAIRVLGGGSNVLIADEGIRGLVISMRSLKGLSEEIVHTDQGPVLKLLCLAGTSKMELLKVFLKHKLAPALFLAGLPGDIGGGIVMNAGVAEGFHPREFGELVEWIEVVTLSGQTNRIYSDHIQWTYRHSQGWQEGVIVRAQIQWPLKPDDKILEKVKEANRVRFTKQPLELPSCGSVFINPHGHKAAVLIDKCGLKGFTVGGAQVSTKHANFIVNLGSATAKDILEVISHIQKNVFEQTGFQLKTEVVQFN